ncbi:MAG: hypothetical protein E5V67_09270 [Mesorhizobium sp.]|uniref:hypothetical protein n=1 Tax=Mesorhizobium sp. M00.F.Ca.ET.217.01.1.1 TaxID=2500529 RepID=UPI000FDB91DC|nr:hypothetical protein [Mesorhizobium sp. M00.F.Ca.ET.217.01.1.1]TGQ20038.1 hypothetical protein EN860_014920 [Mesorhizobium sp. M00.F.Ca.ET.217.01.1.1]TGV94509.1 hypothetical protein EN801_002440 [Mesorhizobium sp. M00.F.Ca.ET.158.01.1.1]TKB40049.1 MAG: hypothetical protein E5V67_09270 [Mesorhizobium sp.]
MTAYQRAARLAIFSIALTLGSVASLRGDNLPKNAPHTPRQMRFEPANLYTIRPTLDEEADPRFYGYSEKTALALGLGFEPRDITDFKRPCIDFVKTQLDAGPSSTNFSLTYVKDASQLDFATHVDSKANAAFLVFKANASFSMDTKFAYDANSISVVMTAETHYGRWGLDPKAKLTPEATALLTTPTKFAETCGTRYVAVEDRASSISVLITLLSVDTDIMTSFQSEFGGSGGWGQLSASAQAKFSFALSLAAQQDRLVVGLGAVGGKGLGGLKDSIESLAQIEKDPAAAILKALGNALAGFDANNAAPILYTVASMEQFGFDASAIDPWTDLRERNLRGIVAEYRRAAEELDVVSGLGDGTFPLSKVLPQADIDSALRRKPDLQTYVNALAAQHHKCKENLADAACDIPPGRVVLFDSWFWNKLKPPRFYVVDFHLDEAARRVVLAAKKGNRIYVAKTFNPAVDVVRPILTFRGDQYLYTIRNGFHYYRDNTDNASDAEAYVGQAYLWVEEPTYRNPNIEDADLEWYSKHPSGSYEGYAYFEVVDKMGRKFRLNYADVSWTVSGGRITQIEQKFLY